MTSSQTGDGKGIRLFLKISTESGYRMIKKTYHQLMHSIMHQLMSIF